MVLSKSTVNFQKDSNLRSQIKALNTLNSFIKGCKFGCPFMGIEEAKKSVFLCRDSRKLNIWI